MAARLRLVDEVNGVVNGDTWRERHGDASPQEAAAPVAKAKRGPGAESEVAPRGRVAPASRARVRASKRASTVADVMRSPAVCCRLGDTLHQVDERVPVVDLERLTVIYRHFLEGFFANARP